MDKKEVATLNVNVDADLFNILGKVSNLTGKTKSALVEEAVINIVSPYCMYDDPSTGHLVQVIWWSRGG